jgi:putative ATP-dependent endonuclease of the OLD family
VCIGELTKLKRVRLRNFRCYQAETSVDFDALTAFVGRNDAGKSAILDAMGMFFGEYSPDADDACLQGDKSDMTVICEFTDLPKNVLIDANRRVSPADEWLLNARGFLEIHRVFNGALQKPKLTRTFLIARHPAAQNYNDLLYLKNSDLKVRAQKLGVDLDATDQRVNSELRHAIWNSCIDLELCEQEIDIEKEDAKKIWVALSKQLPVFALFHSDRKSTDQDDEAQDPLKKAVEEALQAQAATLDVVSAFVHDQVLGIARATVKKLQEMDPTLAQELNPRFAKPNWAKVFGISLTDDSQIPINKRGSGVRRLILLNFFRAKAEKRLNDEDTPGIIYAIEEPETSQHPKNQRILLSALRELSEQPGCQVIFTTHTPVLVCDVPLDSLKHVTVDETGARTVIQYVPDTYRTIASALGVIPDHDVRVFIGVEGMNDIDFLCNISGILRAGGEDVLDLRSLEAQGKVIFIPVGGSNLILWTHRLANLNRPEFHLYDRDEQPPLVSSHQATIDALTARGATAILTGKREMENYLHPDAIAASLGINLVYTDFDDVPNIVAEAVHIAGGGQEQWGTLDEEKKRKKVSRVKRRLNSEATLAMTPALLTAVDPRGDVRGWFNSIRGLYDS